MKSNDIREGFLKYFESHGHRRVPSSSLVPASDPTLLFTNAGMVPFKDAFLGLVDLGYARATSSQKCVRAGGKHNDLENVGFTPRHHTFFEMLGNFSFGNYFKKEAIGFAWGLLTEELKIPKDRLRITVFETDDEAFELWKAQGVRSDWIIRLGEKDNFWAMGDTGPCGPCTEIHFDWGDKYGCGKPDCQPGCPCDTRFLEIWNLVFMQYNRSQDGKLTPLPKPSVDTGAGLERLSCVLQGKYSNYETDLFLPILDAIGARVGLVYGKDESQDVAMRVVADHLRSSSFLMADGVNPSNEGRGYVLRRILRRAIRYGKKLGQDKPFIFELLPTLVSSMGTYYPELKSQQKLISTLIQEEEMKFHETLHRGIGVLDDAISKAKRAEAKQLSGDVAFKLYDTFGFPLDLTEMICREQGLTVDGLDFEKSMEKQRSQSQWSTSYVSQSLENIGKVLGAKATETKFLGYETLKSKGKLIHLFDDKGSETQELAESKMGFVVLDQTPFYAESGGQVGDQGRFKSTSFEARVDGVQKLGKVILHRIHVTQGSLKANGDCELSVESVLRKRTAINHTATHMLHAALRNILGDRVKQAGSLVDAERLRFDFTYPKAVTESELAQIEKSVNEAIQEQLPVSSTSMKHAEAIQSGALAFFDEKYGDEVRVIRVGPADKPYSVELCGGTHLSNVSEIGLVKITSESSVASGVRRLEAITSVGAFEYLLSRDRKLKEVEGLLGTKDVVEKQTQLQSDLKTLIKQNEQLRLQLAQRSMGGGSEAVQEKTKIVNGVTLFIDQVSHSDAKILRTLMDQTKDRLKEKAVIAIASVDGGRIQLCVGVTKDLVGRYHAGDLVKSVAPAIGGTGGGRPDFAQAGGTKPEGFGELSNLLENLLKENS